jgi:PAS domain S-box-containing protein
MLDADRRLHRFLASAPDPTLIVDGAGSILFASAQVEPVFGYAPGEIVGIPVESLMPDRFRTGHRGLFQAYFSAPNPRPMGAGLELYARRKDGTEFPVEISLGPVDDETNGHVICAIRDVSDRRKLEGQLRATASEAERANAVKSRFLAAASHDLRQPLQATTTYLSLLTKQVKTAEQQALCTKMRGPLHMMSNILNALLDISMLDSGLVTPKRSDFALSSVLERVAVDLSPLAQEKNLSFLCSETDLFVNSDPALLERIVENLASNAIRYTTVGSVIVRADKVGAAARISVVDTGIGIPGEAVERIFDEYFQFDNPARNIKKGLGLGLAIVKRLASLLDHPIQVRSIVGKGSSFMLDIPLAQVELASDATQNSTGELKQGQRQLAVLFIDDDSAVADSLSMFFAAAGLDAVATGDGDEAVASCKKGFRPDVLVSDYRMPNENGLAVVARLRQVLGRTTPAIVMTGDTSLRHIEAQNVANLKVVQKPVDPDTLMALIQAVADNSAG